jgi:hypothetical protein
MGFYKAFIVIALFYNSQVFGMAKPLSMSGFVRFRLQVFQVFY